MKNLRLWLLGSAVAITSLLIFTDSLPRVSFFLHTPSNPDGSYSSASVVPGKETSPALATLPDEPVKVPPNTPREETPSTYIEIKDGCGPYFGGACITVRGGPSTSSPKVTSLRNGVVLKTSGAVENEGHTWYKITFDEWIRYPERVKGDWYVAGDFVNVITDMHAEELSSDHHHETFKRILVDRSDQMLYAYDGDELFMKEFISAGLDLTPTPRGIFTIYRKTPSRYMQGPLPGISEQYFDLPGVPWNLYFTEAGGAIHGAFWHDKFGQPWSHGCVNLPYEKAKELYMWADLGTSVTVRD